MLYYIYYIIYYVILYYMFSSFYRYYDKGVGSDTYFFLLATAQHRTPGAVQCQGFTLLCEFSFS